MGVTAADIPILQNIIRLYRPKTVMELGAQTNYARADMPYMSEWYKAKGMEYQAIDLTGENNSNISDLSESFYLTADPLPDLHPEYNKHLQFDLVTDFGTSEHICGKTKKFSWQAIYNCWLNKHNLLKTGGVMISENPKTGSWAGHGYNYYTQEFYKGLIIHAGYTIEGISEVAAMGNTTDGWNVMCIMRKFSDQFPTLKEFKTLDLRTS